jgi:hypothetical protein
LITACPPPPPPACPDPDPPVIQVSDEFGHGPDLRAAYAGVGPLLIIAVVIPTAHRAAIASTKNIVVLINFNRRIIYKKIYRK